MHARGKATCYPETNLLPSRDLEDAAFVKVWIDSHGPPKIVSADREFVKSPLTPFPRDYGISLQERPARRRNEIGVVESNHNCLRLFAVLKDAECWRLSKGLEIFRQEILSKA